MSVTAQGQDYGDFFENLERGGIKTNPEQRAQIEGRINAILNYTPRVGVLGKTGTGKSTLCNALFGQDVCEVSDIGACTRKPQETLINMGDGKGIALVDVPGAGENEQRDAEYADLYAHVLPELDVILWLVKADDRAMASDENYYNNVVKHHVSQGKPFFFVLNQVDKIEPFREWDIDGHRPGNNQLVNIHKKIQITAEQFGVPVSKIIPISATEKYNLTTLVDEFVRALPAEKQITTFHAVSDEFRSEGTERIVEKSFIETVGEIVKDVAKIVKDISDIIIVVGKTIMKILG